MTTIHDFVHEIKKDGFVLRILQDTDVDSPREWENLGTIICCHRKYLLSDDKKNHTVDELNRAVRDAYLTLPIYMYDHSGITISTKPFGCAFDSGQVGWIYVTRAKILKEFDCTVVSSKLKERVLSILESEISDYDKYLRGDTYMFYCAKEAVCNKCNHVEENHVESCGGFFGSNWFENGMHEHLPEPFDRMLEVEFPEMYKKYSEEHKK